MSMSIHWSPRSPFVRKAMVAAYEKGIADRIECIRTKLPSEDKDHPIFKDNPLGRMPALILENGRRIQGSSVICEYFDILAETPRLFPLDPEQRLQTRLQEEWGDGLMEIAFSIMFERYNPTERSPAIVDRQINKVRKTLSALEALAPGFSGTAFDIGHIAIAVALGYLDFRFEEESWREGRPVLAGWFENISERPSMKATAFNNG